MIKKCLVCHKGFKVKPSSFSRRRHCSLVCKSVSESSRMVGNKFNDGSRCGPKNCRWKGSLAGYHAIHLWLNANYGRPDHCEKCGRTRPPSPVKKNYFHWSNKTGKLIRQRSNWQMFCAKCHEDYDRRILNKNYPYKK